MKHNHITRDIKQYGKNCPACDLYHIKNVQKKLKPCPFCKGDIIDLLPQGFKDTSYHFIVRCSSCNVNMNVYTNFPDQAVANWNCRDGKINLTLDKDSV